MNGKKSKNLRILADNLLKAWIVKNSNNPEDFNDAELNNYLPEDIYYNDDRTRKTNFYTKRWTVKKLKRILKKNENITVENLKDIL